MVAKGDNWVPPEIFPQFVEGIMEGSRGKGMRLSETHELSAREQQVLDLLLENLAIKEIVPKLNSSERTVGFHAFNLLAKYGLGRRANLLLLRYQTCSAACPRPGECRAILCYTPHSFRWSEPQLTRCPRTL